MRRAENKARGYVEVRTPQIYDKTLWETSGHWEKYREHMFTFESENRTFGLKPMNCPGHCVLYAAGAVSYRELPLRMAEAGVLHRDELAGALHGLLRVRMFSARTTPSHLLHAGTDRGGGARLPRVRLLDL